MIKIENISKSFGINHVMKNVSVDFKKGDIVAIRGANGSGKTTFLRLLLGYYRCDTGSVMINGLDSIKDRIDFVEKISFVPQTAPFIKLSLHDLLEFICESSQVDIEKIKYFADLMKLDLESNMKKSFDRLSGGMKQKFLISVAMAENKEIMIFDEPTASLDIKSRQRFYKLLEGVNLKEKIILVIAHNNELDNFINREIELDLGELVSDTKK